MSNTCFQKQFHRNHKTGPRRSSTVKQPQYQVPTSSGANTRFWWKPKSWKYQRFRVNNTISVVKPKSSRHYSKHEVTLKVKTADSLSIVFVDRYYKIRLRWWQSAVLFVWKPIQRIIVTHNLGALKMNKIQRYIQFWSFDSCCQRRDVVRYKLMERMSNVGVCVCVQRHCFRYNAFIPPSPYGVLYTSHKL